MIAYIEPRGGTIGAFLKFVSSDGKLVHDRGDVLDKQNLSNGFVSWSPDGRRLAAVSLPRGIFWIDLDRRAGGRDTPFRKLLDLTAGVLLRGMSWSRDGSSLIVGRIQSAGDIFLLSDQ